MPIRVTASARLRALTAFVFLVIAGCWADHALAGNIPPTSAFSTPSSGAVLTDQSVALAGTATDTGGSGLDRVQLAFWAFDANGGQGGWFDPANGTVVPTAVRTTASLASPGANSSGWNASVQLPFGRYRAWLISFDQAGNAQDGWVRRDFSVIDVSADNDPPTTAFSTPAAGAVLTDPTITLTGTAQDSGGSGLDRVQLAFWWFDANGGSGGWLNPATGGTSASSVRISAVLDSPGSSSSGWSATVQVPFGRYRAWLISVDRAGTVQAGWNRRDFSVVDLNSDTQPPTTSFSSPAAGSVLLDQPVTLTGSAQDTGGSGLDRVQLAFWSFNANGGQGGWLNPATGAIVGSSVRVNATLNAPGANSSAWSLSVQLPVGEYRAWLRGIDRAGRVQSGWNRRDFSVANPNSDSTPPLATVAVPADGGVTLTTDFAASGTATDTGGAGVARVLVALYSLTEGSWLNPDNGAASATSIRRDASLDNPLANQTGWSRNVVVPASGRYRLYVLAIDGAQNVQAPANGSRWRTSTFDAIGLPPPPPPGT